MPLFDRNEIERKLARVLGRDLRSEMDKLLGYLGDPPDLSRVPYDYWQTGWKDIQKDVEPILVDTFLAQAESLMGTVAIGADWANVNMVAADWARNHGETILKELFNKTYEGVNKTVPMYFEQGWRYTDLSKALEGYYSPIRAEMIAITETTRAAVEGERALVAELAKESGKEMIPIWLTSNDERVCPICSPRNEKPIINGRFPPAHPRCRCGVAWEWPKETE